MAESPEAQAERVRRHEEITERLLEEELAKYGTVRMPWVLMPGEHPYSIGWRMGYGESHRYVVWKWQTRLTPEEREAAVRAAGPVPADWVWWAGSFVGALADDEEPPFEQVKAVLAARNIEVAGVPMAGIP